MMNQLNTVLTLVDDLSTVWHPQRFSISRHPQYVGTIYERLAFSSPKVSCLDMLVKKPFSPLRNPYIDRGITEFIDRCLEFEKRINPHWQHYYTYLTIDQRRVKAGFTHRREGVHFDGMQGAAYPQKMPVCHSYVASDSLPTRFYTHPFRAMHLNEATDNWYANFEQQARKEVVFYPGPFDIFLMSAYQVHEAIPAIASIQRTFMRLEFSLKTYNRIGNTLNPLLSTNWTFVDREIPLHLRQGRFRDTGWGECPVFPCLR